MSDTLTLPANLSNDLRRLLSAIYFQDLTYGSTGTWMALEIPQLTDNNRLSIVIQAIYVHFQASFHAGANTRLYALAPTLLLPGTLAAKIADCTPFNEI